MKALGTLSHETKSGNLVIRGNEAFKKVPSIYSFAAANKVRVGKIQDVIGPVERPYVVLKPQKKLTKKELSKLKSATFYESSRRKNAKTRRNSTRQKSRVH